MGKKIIVLNGSPRKNGNTSALVKAFREGAESAGHSVTEFWLEGMKIKDIAQRRFVEPSTVKSQVRTLLQKFSLSRTSEIVTKIRELKLEHLFPVS